MTDLVTVYEQLQAQGHDDTWTWSMLASKYKLSCFDVWNVYTKGSRFDNSSYASKYIPPNTLTDVKLIASLHDAPSTVAELINYVRFTMANHPWPEVHNKWELGTMREKVVNMLMESMAPYCSVTTTLKDFIQAECLTPETRGLDKDEPYPQTETLLRTLLKGIDKTPEYDDLLQWLVEKDAPILKSLIWDLDKQRMKPEQLLMYFVENTKTHDTASAMMPIILKDATLPPTIVRQLVTKYPDAASEHMHALKTYLKNQRLSYKSQKAWLECIAHEIEPRSLHLVSLKNDWEYPLKDMSFLNWAPLEKITIPSAMRWYDEINTQQGFDKATEFFTLWLQKVQPHHEQIFANIDCGLDRLREHSINKKEHGSPYLNAFWAYALSYADKLPQRTVKNIQDEWGHNITTPTGKTAILKKYAGRLKEWNALATQLELDPATRWSSYVASISAAINTVELPTLDMSH